MGAMLQEYNKYTAEDQEVWNILFKRQMQNLPEAATEEFLLGLDRIKFTAERFLIFRRPIHYWKPPQAGALR